VTFISTLRVRDGFVRNRDFEGWASNMEKADAKTLGDGHISDVDGRFGRDRTDQEG
jgi:hypothetical protein